MHVCMCACVLYMIYTWYAHVITWHIVSESLLWWWHNVGPGYDRKHMFTHFDATSLSVVMQLITGSYPRVLPSKHLVPVSTVNLNKPTKREACIVRMDVWILVVKFWVSDIFMYINADMQLHIYIYIRLYIYNINTSKFYDGHFAASPCLFVGKIIGFPVGCPFIEPQ